MPVKRCKMPLRMFAAAIPRGVIERGRRCASAERPIVADICPDPPGDRLALGQDRHRGVVAVQPLGGHHVRFDQPHAAAAGAVVQAPTWSASVETLQIDAFAFEALALTVERLMLAELVEQDHRQQVAAR